MERLQNSPKAVIAGAGLAGLACAKRLVDAGFQVELVEAEPVLGGRTASWQDEDKTIESGIHTFFGTYTHLTRLLNEVGLSLDDVVKWDTKIAVVKPNEQWFIFGIDPLRDLPSTIAGVIGNNSLLNPVDKLTLGLAFLNGILDSAGYESQTLQDFARTNHLDEQIYERVLRPLARGLFFLEPEELTAYAAFTLIRNNLFYPVNFRTGTFRGGMTEVMINPLANWIRNRGGSIHVGSPVKSIRYNQNRISGFELRNGHTLVGDVYVSALPLEVFKNMIPPDVQTLPYFRKIKAIETVPATSIQLWFDKSFIGREEFVLPSRTPLIVLQDESFVTFPSATTRISCQITDRKTDSFSDEQYIDLAVSELRRYFPAAWGANLVKSLVVRHQAFAMKPGTAFLRPNQATPVSNFFLAGDYTRQDWFTTMEGAVRSGEKAARKIVQSRSAKI